MAEQQKKAAVPIKIQGRSYTGKGSIKDIVLYILECTLKDSSRGTGDDLVIR